MAGLNLFTNNAATTLATGINSSVTSLTVASATGGLFPNPTAGQYFYCTLSNAAGTTIEIVKVTARSTDTFTIVRGQDGTTAAAFIAGDKVELRLTAADLQNFPQLDSTNTFSQTQTFVAPILGTPTSGTLTNCTGYTTANLSGSIGLTTQVTGTLPIANGGTGATSLAAATIATQGYTTTATAAGTTTLTVSSTQLQFFTGTTTQTVVLPVASTLTAGQRFEIHNNSTGSVTVNSSGANLVATVLPNTTTVLTCILTSGTSAASWDADVQGITTTVPVALGGTGRTTNTAYAVICGGTTAGGVEQSIASVGTAGQILTSNGAGALPTFQAAAGGGGLGGITVYTSNATFTIPTGKTVVKVTVVGGGGGGGGAVDVGCGSGYGGGGGAAGMAIKYLTGLTPGNTLTVTVGAGGTAGSAAPGNGGTGGTSSVASGTQTITTISATGGGGGTGNTGAEIFAGTSGAGSNGDINVTGNKTSNQGGGSNGTPAGTGQGTMYAGSQRMPYTTPAAGIAGNTGGGGASGGYGNGYGGGVGGVGIVIFEY